MSRLWLKIFLLPPDLLKRHAQGYTDLAAQELSQHLQDLGKRLFVGASGVVALLLGIALGGVALLLWSALPQLNAQWSWVLLALPLGLVLLGLALTWSARTWTVRPVFPKLRQQVQLDTLVLQQSGKP